MKEAYRYVSNVAAVSNRRNKDGGNTALGCRKRDRCSARGSYASWKKINRLIIIFNRFFFLAFFLLLLLPLLLPRAKKRLADRYTSDRSARNTLLSVVGTRAGNSRVGVVSIPRDFFSRRKISDARRAPPEKIYAIKLR